MARRKIRTLTMLLAVSVSGLMVGSTGAGASTGASDQAVAYQIDVAHSGGLSGDALTPLSCV